MKRLVILDRSVRVIFHAVLISVPVVSSSRSPIRTSTRKGRSDGAASAAARTVNVPPTAPRGASMATPGVDSATS